MLQLQEIDHKQTWEDFLLSSQLPTIPFFQSWSWGDVQQKLGNKIYRFGIYEGKKLVGIVLAVEINARRGKYLHVRHGPVLHNPEKDLVPFVALFKEFAQKVGVDFVRMSPIMLEDTFDIEILRELGFRNAPIHNMDAENAWILRLTPSEEQLLAGMRKTTRYLVRKAQQLPVVVKVGTDEKEFNAFMELYKETSQRHKFVPHRGLREEFLLYSKENQAELFLAYYEGNVIAGALIIYYGNQAVYHHGASSDAFKEIPAAYLLQWQAICEAKKRGLALYNFWGVVPPEKPNHPWRGLTLFKTGFGGEQINFIHAQDLPIKPTYWKTYLIETYSKLRKGY